MSSDPHRSAGPSPHAHGHLVPADGGERLTYGGMEFAIRASAESTGGAFSVIEEINPVDTPMHRHERHDELFYVLEGDHVFTVGGTEHEAGPGDLVFGPRGVPHAQRRVVPRTGRILTMFSPAGFEGFFRDLAEAGRLGDDGPEALTRIAAHYDSVWVG